MRLRQCEALARSKRISICGVGDAVSSIFTASRQTGLLCGYKFDLGHPPLDKTEALVMNQDTFSRNARNKLKQVFDALRELKTPPDPPKRHIGLINPEDSNKTKKAQAKRKV